MDEREEHKTAAVDGEVVRISDAGIPAKEIEVKNPRIGKVLGLEEEVRRQKELEELRSRRIRMEQEYIDRMLVSVEENLRNTKEEQRINEEFEAHIKSQVYRMHGISQDKLEGMKESRRAWYQGAAFALFFLSLVLIALCGILHGFGSEICIFMAFYTAIEGALLSNGRKQSRFLEYMIRILYLLLFPMMMVIFVCYELGFAEYHLLVPIFTLAGTVVLVIGAVSYFIYDPYRVDRRNQKKANRYIREMEKAALKEVKLKEKAFGKLERKKEKQAANEEKKRKKKELREIKRQEKGAVREEKREKRRAYFAEKKQKMKERLPIGKKMEPQSAEVAEASEEPEIPSVAEASEEPEIPSVAEASEEPEIPSVAEASEEPEIPEKEPAVSENENMGS